MSSEVETSRNSLVRDSYINILYEAINVGSAALPLRLPHLDFARNDNKDQTDFMSNSAKHNCTQLAVILIPQSREKDPAYEAWDTLDEKRDPNIL
jgi:hypothetical protein